MNSINIQELRSCLPHRYPFLLLDRVLEFTKHKSLTAIKNVTYNEPFFSGHFPQEPVMPGVLVIEALAQAAGVLIYKSADLKPYEESKLFTDDNRFFLVSIDNARFKCPVRPGDQLKLQVELIRMRRNFWKFQCIATVDEQVVCTAEIMNARGSADDR